MDSDPRQATTLPDPQLHTDEVDAAKLFSPVDHGPDDVVDLPPDVTTDAPPAPPGAPLAQTILVIVEIAVNHLTPSSPLTPMERDQLRVALDGLEAYYGPIAGGPAVLWGHLAVIVFWIGFPRYLSIRAARAAAAEAAASAAVEPGG